MLSHISNLWLIHGLSYIAIGAMLASMAGNRVEAAPGPKLVAVLLWLPLLILVTIFPSLLARRMLDD